MRAEAAAGSGAEGASGARAGNGLGAETLETTVASEARSGAGTRDGLEAETLQAIVKAAPGVNEECRGTAENSLVAAAATDAAPAIPTSTSPIPATTCADIVGDDGAVVDEGVRIEGVVESINSANDDLDVGLELVVFDGHGGVLEGPAGNGGTAGAGGEEIEEKKKRPSIGKK